MPAKNKKKISPETVQETTEKESSPLVLPVLPLRDVVVYPHMVIPLFVGREKSIHALEAAMIEDKQVLLVAQKHAGEDDPKSEDIYSMGTISVILQLLKLPDGTVKMLVEGRQRGAVKKVDTHEKGYFVAEIDAIETPPAEPKTRETEILVRSLMSQFEQYVKLNRKIPPEIFASLSTIEDEGCLADMIAAHLSLKVEEKQELLESLPIPQRLERLMSALETEIDLLQVEKRVRGRVKRQMEKSQREYYLNEQMKAIQKELGELGNELPETEQLAKNIEEAGMPEEAKTKALAELTKLKMMPPMSAEATVIRNYLDWMLKVPWKTETRIRYDLEKAEAVLDEDHYGLGKVKERIIEYLAVERRVKKIKGPILCLVGPPGVGKTSLGQSIANATGRKFIRIALGGVRDEAEIRGHRRTYIGSMPGRIIQRLAKAGVSNPLIMLDEVDKMAADFRGDPASALLEVLDPEQNHAFNDHFLEVDYDLSRVMFIATANSLEIPPALLDRMEVIRLPGYIEDEKIRIAEQHLINKQIELSGLRKDEIHITESAVRDIIRYYTREAGVRNLDRNMAKICRKVLKERLVKEKKQAAKSGKKEKIRETEVSSSNLEKYLGVRQFHFGLAEKSDAVGCVTGLAWTSVGGELLTIEASAMPGKGKALYTGHLGSVMQESIQAAMTVVRHRGEEFGLPPDFHDRYDFHVHVPEGATPKDGPSAGIAMCTALMSVLTKIPVKANVAMTGEITLQGKVLPIGGLKEKLIAAHRGGITDVIIPFENEKDLEEIPKNIRKGLHIHLASVIDDVLKVALADFPEKKSKLKVKKVMPKKAKSTKTTRNASSVKSVIQEIRRKSSAKKK
jgi:ATP-dependent Lon protease